MPSISIEGRSLHYREVGKGTPVLLLHAFPVDSESYWPALESPPPGVRLIVPDHRGFGESTPGGGPLTMDEIASDALALLDALGVPSAVVGGASMGGYAAMALTQLDPSRVAGLLLLGTQCGADDAAGKERREKVAREVEANGTAGLVKEMLPKLLSKTPPPETVARLEAIMSRQSAQAVAAAARGMALRPDRRDILSRFQGPALVMVGADDQITPRAKAEEMAGLLPNGSLQEVARAGHLAHLEAPGEILRAVSMLVLEYARVAR